MKNTKIQDYLLLNIPAMKMRPDGNEAEIMTLVEYDRESVQGLQMGLLDKKSAAKKIRVD